jgi:hypothetical protein
LKRGGAVVPSWLLAMVQTLFRPPEHRPAAGSMFGSPIPACGPNEQTLTKTAQFLPKQLTWLRAQGRNPERPGSSKPIKRWRCFISSNRMIDCGCPCRRALLRRKIAVRKALLRYRARAWPVAVFFYITWTPYLTDAGSLFSYAQIAPNGKPRDFVRGDLPTWILGYGTREMPEYR